MNVASFPGDGKGKVDIKMDPIYWTIGSSGKSKRKVTELDQEISGRLGLFLFFLSKRRCEAFKTLEYSCLDKLELILKKKKNFLRDNLTRFSGSVSMSSYRLNRVC
jgi:hypothetical protein